MRDLLLRFFQLNGTSSWSAPFSMVRKDGTRFFIFLLTNFVLGLLGVWITAVAVPIFVDQRFVLSEFARSLNSGSLYTFTIVFLTYSVILLQQVKANIPSNERIKRWKTVVIAVAMICVLIIGLFAGMQALLEALKSPSDSSRVFTLADYVQIISFFIGSVLAIYCFLLASYEEELDNFAEIENATVGDLGQKSSATVKDARNIEL